MPRTRHRRWGFFLLLSTYRANGHAVEKTTKAVSVLSSRLQVQSNVTSLSCFIQVFFVCWFAPAGAFNCAKNGVIVNVPWSRETPIPHPVPLGPSVRANIMWHMPSVVMRCRVNDCGGLEDPTAWVWTLTTSTSHSHPSL